MKVAIAGATGLVGRLIAEGALERSHETTCLVRPRSQSKGAVLEARGARIVLGDIGSQGALDELCAGADVVISTVTSTSSTDPSDSIERIDEKGNLALIDACERAGVSRFVFLSFPEQELTAPLGAAKKAVENRLKGSAMNATIIHLPFVIDVWLTPFAGFDVALGKARLIGTGESRVPWISATDAARATLDAAASTAGTRTLHLPGSDHASIEEITQAFEKATGRQFHRDTVSLDTVKEEFAKASEPKQLSFWAICWELGRGYAVPSDPTFVPLQGISDYVRAAVDTIRN